jgi:hypothetical protein
MARSKMWNAVVSNAKANNISNEESFQQLMDDSSKELSHSMRTYQVNWSSGISCSVSWVNGVLDYLLKSVLKAVQVGLILRRYG